MKRSLIIAIAAAMLLSTPSTLFANLTGINLLSQSHRVWGGTFPDDYDLTSTTAVTGSSPLTYAQAGNFSVKASSSGNDLVNVQGGHAISSYIFMIENNKLEINLDGNIWCTLPETEISYSLTDKTASKTLDTFTYSGYDWTPPIFGNSYCHYYSSLNGLDKSHTYELYLYAFASTGDGGNANLYANLSSPCQVPAPSAILLTTLGTLTTGWLKRRKNIC